MDFDCELSLQICLKYRGFFIWQDGKGDTRVDLKQFFRLSLDWCKAAAIDPTTNLRKFAAECVDQAVDPEVVGQHVEVGRRAFRAVALAALNPDRRSENNNSFNAACLLTLASTIKRIFSFNNF